MIYEYITGEREVDLDKIEGDLENIYHDVWYNPFLKKQIQVNWSTWRKTHFGFLCYLAQTQIKYDKKKELIPKEVSVLAGITPNAVRNKIKEGKIDAHKLGGVYLIEYEGYKDLAYFR